MHSIHIHGYPTALGAISFAVGAILWRYKKLHRWSGLGFALGAFFLAIGVIPWLDALATLTGSGTGTVVLLIIDVISFAGIIFEVILKHQHHRIRTPVLAVTGGTCLVVTLGILGRLLTEAERSPGKTTAALSQSVAQIRSGQATHAMQGHQALVILFVAAVILISLMVIAHKAEKKTPARGVTSLPGRRPAIGGRPAIGAGRRGR
jgi:hypothetical protein